jgi:hypothetical protein
LHEHEHECGHGHGAYPLLDEAAASIIFQDFELMKQLQ